MRSETRLCAAALVLALAAPSYAQTAEPRVLPSAAAHYGEYQGEVSSLQKNDIKAQAELDKALTTFGSQNADQLSSGWVAYSALIAAQDKDFAKSVRDADAAYGREAFVTGMRNNVGYVRTFNGAEGALQEALAANQRDAGRISSAAAFLKEQGHKVAGFSWGKAKLSDTAKISEKLKANAKVSRPASDSAQKLFAGPDLGVVLANSSAGEKSVWDSVSILAAAPTAALTTVGIVSAQKAPLKVTPKREGTANRIVTLAAFHVLEAEKTNNGDMKSAMKDKPTWDCIDWSQMQLQACVSAAYTRADLSFCLADHGVRDTGACFADVAK